MSGARKRGSDAPRRAAAAVAALTLGGISLCALHNAHAQAGGSTQFDAVSSDALAQSAGQQIAKPSQKPAFQIPVAPLGYSAPSEIYLGHRFTFVSLDFADENRLLFTFRVPGLIHRNSTGHEENEEHYIRATVINLPSGRVESEALWTLYDRERYLWMLKDGSFLLRDGNDLKKGSASLEAKPFLHFPGPLLWLETDPSQQYLATGSREPAAARQASDATASGGTNATKQTEASSEVVRILRRDSGQVLLVSRTGTSIRLSINGSGYLESQQSSPTEWKINLHSFNGGVAPIGRLISTCAPSLSFLSQIETVATTCTSSGAHELVAMNSEGLHLWEVQMPEIDIWPQLILSPDGSWLARETLAVSRQISASAPLSTDDIAGQIVEIYDTQTGKVVLKVPITPALDGGGNVAISPSGRRLAVLSNGSIEVFDLPAPASARQQSGSVNRP